MSQYHAYQTYVSINNGSERDMSPYLSDAGFSRSVDEMDNTTFSASGRTYNTGLPGALTVDDNTVPSVFYTDLNLSYDTAWGGQKLRFFGNVTSKARRASCVRASRSFWYCSASSVTAAVRCGSVSGSAVASRR